MRVVIRFQKVSQSLIVLGHKQGRVCLLTVGLIGLLSTISLAQNSTQPGSPYVLPPLDSLIATCWKNSPELELTDVQMKEQYYKMKNQKNDWSERIVGNVAAGVGNRFFVQGFDGTSGVINTYTPYYNAGIVIALPLSQMVNRKNRVEMAESGYEAARVQKEIQAQELADRVTVLYYQVATNINVLKIRGDALQTMRIQKSLADNDLKNGNISIGEMSSIIYSLTEEESNYEAFKQKFLMSWKQLENLTGQPLKLTP